MMHLCEKIKDQSKKCFEYKLYPDNKKGAGMGKMIGRSNVLPTGENILKPVSVPRRVQAPTEAITIGSYLGHIYYNTYTDFYFDDYRVGELSPGQKVYVNFNNKVYIFPDRRAYNLRTCELEEIHQSVTEVIHIEKRPDTCDFIARTVMGVNLAQVFKNAKSIQVTGSENGAFDGCFKIIEKSIDDGTICFGQADYDFDLVSETVTTVSTAVPMLEGACVCQNRIFGFYQNTVCACAVGDGDSWCECGEDGAFSQYVKNADRFCACESIGGECVFFTENNAFKVYGDNALEFSLRVIPELGGISGYSLMAHTKSEDNIYFLNKGSIMRYSGVISERICTLEGRNIRGAILFAHYDRLYIYYRSDSPDRLCMLDIPSGVIYDLFVPDLSKVKAIFEYGDAVCVATDYQMIAIDTEFSDAFDDFYEDRWTASEAEFDEVYDAYNNFTPLKLYIRGGMKSVGRLEVYCMTGNSGEWQRIGEINREADKIWGFSLPYRETDSFRLKLTGWGNYEVKNIYFVYS